MNGAYYAYNDWVRTTRDPAASYTDKLQAFHRYSACCNQLTKARPVQKRDWNRQNSWLELAERLRDTLQDWVQRVIQWFRTGSMPSSAELNAFENEVADEMETAFEELADDVYRDAMGDAAEDIGGEFQPQFGGRHERTLNLLLDRSTVPDTFRSLSDTAGDVLLDELERAFEAGEQSVDTVVNAVTDRLGTEVFDNAEMVARTEMWKLWAEARQETYREAEERRDEEFKYAFGLRHLGPTPRGNAECERCSVAIEATKDGLPWDEFVETLVDIATDESLGGSSSWDPLRDGTVPLIHPNCRHTHGRVQE